VRREMSNSQFSAIVGVIIILLIGMLLLERYRDCQEKGGSLVFLWVGFSNVKLSDPKAFAWCGEH
jgi:hypothetical protein